MIDFSEILPVGMIAQGGLVAQAMANAAQKIAKTPHWEAFHYEKTSENSFELTGGVVSQQNGSKRWLEPHDSIIISHEQIIEEFAKLSPESIASPHQAQSTHHNHHASQAHSMLTPATDDATAPIEYLHLSLRLPTDHSSREKILKSCHLEASIFGAKIVSCSLSN